VNFKGFDTCARAATGDAKVATAASERSMVKLFCIKISPWGWLVLAETAEHVSKTSATLSRQRV